MVFREKLKQLREAAGASYSQLDRALKPPKTNYTARVERGELPVPDKATVMQLGDVLREQGAKTSGSELWELAAPEAAQAIDPGIREYYEGLVQAARTGQLTESEQRLIEALRLASQRDAQHCERQRRLAAEDDMPAEEVARIFREKDIPAGMLAILEGIDAGARTKRKDPAVFLRTVLPGISELSLEARGFLVSALAELLVVVWFERGDAASRVNKDVIKSLSKMLGDNDAEG